MRSALSILSIVLVMAGLAAPATAVDEAQKRAQAEQPVAEFWERVWSPPPDLQAVDVLVVEDFVLTSAGSEIEGRDAFKAWIKSFQKKAKNVELEVYETLANADATRVTSR